MRSRIASAAAPDPQRARSNLVARSRSARRPVGVDAARGRARRTAARASSSSRAAATGSAAPSSSGRPEAFPARRTASSADTPEPEHPPRRQHRARGSPPGRRAAPGRDDRLPPLRHLAQRLRLAPPEAGLPLRREDVRRPSVPAASSIDLVQVDERPVQALGQQPPDRRLSRRHEADQEDRRVVVGGRHGGESYPNRLGTPKRVNFFAPCPVRVSTGIMSVEVERATLPCSVCGAAVTELRRGRCWGCYTRWAESRPVGRGASCAVCHEKRRAQLKLVELQGPQPPVLPRLRRAGPAPGRRARDRRGAPPGPAPRAPRRRPPRRREGRPAHLPARAPRGRAPRPVARRLRRHRSRACACPSSRTSSSSWPRPTWKRSSRRRSAPGPSAPRRPARDDPRLISETVARPSRSCLRGRCGSPGARPPPRTPRPRPRRRRGGAGACRPAPRRAAASRR